MFLKIGTYLKNLHCQFVIILSALEFMNTVLKRDFPAIEGTSKLSPYLHFGQISPQLLWSKAIKKGFSYCRQLIWREFAMYLYFKFPELKTKPLNSVFEHFQYEKNQEKLIAWQKGLTGYPIVDAGMRELYNTGWMHNRVRMIVGSFLVKDLIIDWREGLDWFNDTLVDADEGNNIFGWQWIAGCGADAAPYFRIFNPLLQSKKFDPKGIYIRKWIPELSHCDDKAIHEPWVYGENRSYPIPIVNHKLAKEKAMLAFNKLKEVSL